MLTKTLNAYKISHLNGSVEEINAPTLVDALENMEIAESFSPVIQTFRLKDNIRTLIADEKAEVTFSSVMSDGTAEGGTPSACVVTPASGSVHTGDKIALKAIPVKNYRFVKWLMNGVQISTTDAFVYTIPELDPLVDTIVFTGVFELAPVAWTVEVSPAEATAAGCLGFPTSGTTAANADLKLLAVAKGDYTFDYWERNGTQITTNELMETTAAILGTAETAAVYKAVFTPTI